MISRQVHMYSASASKKLGQHFIISDEIINQIVDAAGDIYGMNVLEIGPGHGSLTRGILRKMPKKLVAVEKDRQLIAKHTALLASHKGVYQLIEGDALTIDEQHIVEPPVKVIANLPYNISTTLLLKWLNNLELFIDFTLMFQKEVGDRIAATPGGKSYGALSIIVQLFCDVEKMLEFKPDIFSPPPKVDSVVIKVTPLKQPRFPVDLKSLKKVLHALFSQRRKMINTSLKQITDHPGEILQSLNISPTERPENLSIEQFCQLAAKVL